MDERAKPGLDARRPKPNNLRTGLLLGALALFFFVMMFVKRLWLG